MQTTFNPEALCFKPATKSDPHASSSTSAAALNPEAHAFQSSPRSKSNAAPFENAAPLDPEPALFKPYPRLDTEASSHQPETTLDHHAVSFKPAVVLNPEAAIFMPSFRFNPQARSFKPISKLNPEAPCFMPASILNPDAPCSTPTINLDPEVPESSRASDLNLSAVGEKVAAGKPAQSSGCIQEQSCESSLVYGNEHHDVHHINWLGHQVMVKSFTKPATSLAVIMGGSKLLGGEICDLLGRVLYKQIVLRQAFRWIDPVVFTGSRENLGLSGTALENAAIGQTEKFYSECGWWMGDHYDEDEDSPQWDPLDENSYHPTDVVVNGLAHDRDLYLPHDHCKEASVLLNNWINARKAHYQQKTSRPLGTSPLRQVWNASDLDEYDVPLGDWTDEADEMDWTTGNLDAEVKRIREDLNIASVDMEMPSPVVQPGEMSRSPSPSDAELEECNKPASTPATSEGSDTEDCLVCEGDPLLVADAAMNCDTEDPIDKASLLKFMGAELLEAEHLRDLSSPLTAGTINVNVILLTHIPVTIMDDEKNAAANRKDTVEDFPEVAEVYRSDKLTLPSPSPKKVLLSSFEPLRANKKRSKSLSASFHFTTGIHHSLVQKAGEGVDSNALLPVKLCEVTVAALKTSDSVGSTSLHDFVLPPGKFNSLSSPPTCSNTTSTISDTNNSSSSANMNSETAGGVSVNRVVPGNATIEESPVLEEGQVAEMNTTTPATSNDDLGSTSAAAANIYGTVEAKAIDRSSNNITPKTVPDPGAPTANGRVSTIDPNDMSFWEAMNTITPPRRASPVRIPTMVVKPKKRDCLLRGFSSIGKSSVSVVGITPTTARGMIERMRELSRRRSGAVADAAAAAAAAPCGGAAGDNKGASAAWRVRTQILGDGTAVWGSADAEKGEGWAKKVWNGIKGLLGREMNVLPL